MSFLSILKAKTIADYRPIDIYKSPLQLIPSKKLVPVLVESVKRLTVTQIVATEETFDTILSMLTSDLGPYGKLTTPDVKRLNDIVPQLVSLLDSVRPFVRVRLLEFLFTLKTPAAREDFLKRLERASGLETMFSDANERMAMELLIRYFTMFPDVRAFDSLNLIWERSSSRDAGDRRFDVQSWLVKAFGQLALDERHTPSLEILEKAASGYGLSGDDLREARRFVAQAQRA